MVSSPCALFGAQFLTDDRKVWHNPVHERDETKETESQKTCFKFLNLTSRSFAAVIQELHPDLLLPMVIFYLVLRGLDTVEDDPSIPIEIKEPILRNFDQHLTEDGWTFNGNRPEEKDREVLVHFSVIIEEFKKIDPKFQEVIKDICHRMGNGMADYCKNADFLKYGVQTIKDYDLYCHYVAGILGEGCTRMFVLSEKGNPRLLDRPDLHNDMGLFLQMTNIIRDVREDSDDNRFFWPKEIWSQYVQDWDDLFKPAHKEAALNCSSHMILHALERADNCLFYLSGLREQSVFNFCAIPQTMAIATLDLCFRNYNMFQRNIKITKGQACGLMVESTQNLQLVCEVFKRHARSIHKKNSPKDPNFLKISIACGKIEKFVESLFPSQSPDALVKNQPKAPVKSEKEIEAEKESRQDMWILMVAVVAFMAIISIIMVSLPFTATVPVSMLTSLRLEWRTGWVHDST